MEFNIQKFLVENKLTRQSSMRKDDNTGQMLDTDSENDWEQPEMDHTNATFDPNSADPFGGTYATKGSNWDENPGKADYFKTQNGADYDKEPDRNVTLDKSTKDLEAKQKQLSSLEDQKDNLLLQLKSNAISLDQYKYSIGNIPAQIKKLRSDIAKNLSPDLDTDMDAEEEF